MFNLPNKITMFRIILIPVFLVALMGGIFEMETARYVAAAIFIVASLTDFLDGYLARKMNLVTNFGKLADPLADKLLVSAALIAMVSLGDVPVWVCVLIISRELIISGVRQLAAANSNIMAAKQLAKFKAASQMIMIIIGIMQLPYDIFDTLFIVFMWLSVVLTIASAVEYIYKNRELFVEKK